MIERIIALLRNGLAHLLIGLAIYTVLLAVLVMVFDGRP